MINRKSNVDSNFILTEFVLCGIIIFFNLYSKPQIVSHLFTFSFIILATFFLYTIYRNDKKFDLYACTFGIIVVSGVGVLFNAFDPEALVNFENLRNYIIFCSTIIFMFLMLNIDTDKKTAEKILVLNIFISLLYPIGYKFFPQQLTSQVGISLNFSNPNLTAIWILQSILYLSLVILILKNNYLKILSAIALAINMSLMDLTGARNCIIAFFLFAVICVIILLKENAKFPNWFIGIINVVPICFVFVYLNLIGTVVESGIFDFLISKGKTLTSRVEMWERFLGKIDDRWIIGSYFTAGGNSHNSHLVVLCSFGLITLLLTIYFHYKACCLLNADGRSKESLYCLAAFFAVIFMGFGEGALYSGAMGIYIMACGYIYIARCYFGNDENRSEVTQ